MTMNQAYAFVETSSKDKRENKAEILEKAIKNSWLKMAPFWPLKNLIAVNPLAGLEHLSFDKALKQANLHFQQKNIPSGMLSVNRETIKWLQLFFDQGQATIPMPLRQEGLLKGALKLIVFDKRLIQSKSDRAWIMGLNEAPEYVITACLEKLEIAPAYYEDFLTFMLTSLPGWAAHILYQTDWNIKNTTQVELKKEYLAFRLMLTSLLWPDAQSLLNWQHEYDAIGRFRQYVDISQRELHYQKSLIENLQNDTQNCAKERPWAQFVFCIDVRSEPMRRAIESQGPYETFGYAGFFGIPLQMQDAFDEQTYDSCPVLLKAEHKLHLTEPKSSSLFGFSVNRLKTAYQSLKYTLATPFILAEALGPLSAAAMLLKTFFSKWSFFNQSQHSKNVHDLKADIPLEKQIQYAINALKMIGMTHQFAPLIVLCGHGSTSANNAFASSLDCGACGGHKGGLNAQALADILNSKPVRHALVMHDIHIPKDTWFVAAEHNTSTDEVCLYESSPHRLFHEQIERLRGMLLKVQSQLCQSRLKFLGETVSLNKAAKKAAARTQNWGQVRPEWGLAGNAAFIIGPRSLTQNTSLDGRCFLHSYEWAQDPKGEILSSILTAPMIVAQWINAQYFFSTLDNVAFGAGSKVTQNIVSKMGVMQGNASDLMHGLPLQSVFKRDNAPFHECMRLTTLIYGPKAVIKAIIEQHDILKKLFGHGWVHLIALDPSTKNYHQMNRDFTWKKLD